MPVDALSRYRDEPEVLAPGADGVVRATIPARWRRREAAELIHHTAVAGDSFESLAHRYLGSSLLWWRIADVNPTMFPFDLRPGAVVVVPAAAGSTGPVRTRSW